MSRNHYTGVRGRANIVAARAKKIEEEERATLLQQNKELVESIKVRDQAIQDLSDKLSDSILFGMQEALDIFTNKLEKALGKVQVSEGVKGHITKGKVSTDEDNIFINPMDSTLDLEKSFDSLGEESVSEENTTDSKKRLKEILGGSK